MVTNTQNMTYYCNEYDIKNIQLIFTTFLLTDIVLRVFQYACVNPNQLNTQNMTNPSIVSPVKMEYG